MSIVEIAEKIFYDVVSMRDTEPEKKYKLIAESYKEFTQTYMLVVKYMCFYHMYDSKCFNRLLTEISEKKPPYEKSFEFQAEYIRQVLVKKKFSKMEAKKISNKELSEILIQVNQIKRQEKEIKKRDAREKKERCEQRRKELLEFVLEQSDIENENLDNDEKSDI